MAAQDAELKLKVSLDLGFFRQQLAGLGQAAAGYSIPINIKFDRSAITKELRNLERALGKKKINIELNLLGGLTKDQLERIQGRLEALSKTKKVEIPVSVKNGATGRDIQETITGIRQRIAASQQIRQGDGKLRISTSIKPSITNADVSDFKKAVQQKLSGISVKVKAEVGRGFSAGPTGAAGLFEYMRSQGLSGGNVPQATEVGRSERLKKALEDLTVKQLQALAKEQGISGISKLKKSPLIEKLAEEINQDVAENILGNIKNQLRDVGKSPLKGVLDTFARGLFNMLGMDPASMRQQMAQRRALPSVDFPATVPSRTVSIGPSSTGRALPPGAIPSALPGTAFGAQKYLPTNLGAELQEILRKAAYAFIDAVSREVRTAKIGIGASMQAVLPAARVAGLLPAAVGREPSRYAISETRDEMMARRTAEAYARSAARGEAVMGRGGPLAVIQKTMEVGQQQFMRAPSIPAPIGGGGAVPPGGGGRGGAGGMGSFGRAMGGVNLPGAGVIRELGNEFAFATKQVLLFGQAYKMLAFIQDFPAQVGEAVSQLQNFRNTLGAISPTAQEAASSNQLILDLVEKYNVPLQSARDGFTKLYASMAPAGFSGDEIRNLFTGITQAAATFGMSADKVDRVNYAFAQMASKGQVMSEELKGQLGDVLPGAMALFAEAAGFEGPKAIQDFSAALEDGAYKGEAMVALLKNVGVVMNEEFGPGAEGAARTFQGVINRMQNSMTLLYESFEPVAVGFLNTIVVPLTTGIKEVADGFNAFFTGAAARSTGGFAIAQELERLRPTFDGIKRNLGELGTQFIQFAKVAGEVGKIFLQIAGNPIVGYLAKLYAIALPINIALGVMRGLWAANALQLLIFNARVAGGTSTLTAFRGMMAATGATAQTTAASIRTAGITLRTFFATTGVGLVITGISLLIERFMSMNQALADTRAKALGAAQAIRSMSQTEARTEGQRVSRNIRDLETLQKSGQVFRLGGQEVTSVPEDMAKRLQEGGVGIRRDLFGRAFVPKTGITAEILRQQDLQAETEKRQEVLRFDEQQMQQQAVLAPIPLSEKEGKSKKGKELDQYIQDASNALKLEKERQLLAIEDRMLRKEISESEAKQQSLLVEKLFEEKAVKEALRIATLKNNEANLSAADKALKLADMQKEAAQELDNIQKKYGVETLKVQLALQEPLESAISNVNEEITKQAMLGENLSQGFSELSNDQKAYLDVQALVREYTDAEKESVADLINEYQKLREEYYANEEALRKQLAVQEKIDETQMIGGGLRAGFFGQAAGAFEQAMIDSNGDLDYATRMAELETQAMQLRSVFEGLQGAIGGVGQAFGEMMTTGVTSLITGTATAKEVFASFLQSVAQALSQAASQMIATYIAIGLAKMFAGLGGGASADMSKTGISETTLAPMRAYPMASGGVFGPTAFANGGTFTNSIVSGPTMFKFADGGAMNLGLMGEAGPEAIMPLKRGPDGRLGVSMYDASRRAVASAEGNMSVADADYEDSLSMGMPSSRRAASSAAAQAITATRMQVMEQRSFNERRSEMRQIQELVAQPAKINVEYQSQVINNVEYVTRDQAERMSSQSALRGRELALGALQNSVKARKRVGMN